MVDGGRISVWVVYALPQRQALVRLELTAPVTVADAVAESGLVRRYPEIAARPLACAVFGRSVALTQPVRAGDRIEILRALQIDPKESRRQAAARAKGRGTR
jgi:hypothetical protein